MRTLIQVLSLCVREGECLLWTGGANPKGHPCIDHKSGRRWVWEQKNGPIPPGLRVGMSCGCVACLNIKHMVLRTRGEVSAEVATRPSIKHRRSAAGARSMQPRAKLDLEKARYIRESDKTQAELARALGVSQQLISRVRRYEGWIEHTSPFAGLMG